MPARTTILLRHLRFMACSLIGFGLLLTACGGGAFTEPTATPLPTSSLPGLVTVAPQMCQAAKLPMLRVDEPQGDMLAWAPDTYTLAYLAPSASSTWMVGTLMAVSGPDFDLPLELADYAAGHLTWSPQGSALAYLTLRRSDTLYTIAVVYPNSRELIDLFPGEAARTDEYSSQKAVIGWASEGRLQVQVSCGLDCVQAIQVTLPAGAQTLLGTPVQRSWDWWSYRLNSGPALPEEYQEFAVEVNWAPDDRRLVYIDARADAGVIDLDQQIQFPLPTGGFLEVSETDWSYDGKYLAVQAEDWLFIFGECK